MKHLLLSLFLVFSSLTLVAGDVQAKRLGGGANSGMARKAPPAQQQPPAQQPPAKPAEATPAAGTAAAAAPAAAAAKRSWMGPIAGLAAGLGLAALFSWLGLGAELANFLMLILLAAVAFVVVRLLLRKFAPAAMPRMQLAGAGGAPAGFTAPVMPGAAPVPADFDAEGFERTAKLVFIRMQAANDAGNLDDLRKFTTPEMFATFQLDIADRRGAAQRTDVENLEAKVLEVAEEQGQQVVSVRFHGRIREDEHADATPFDEVWHLVKPVQGGGAWAIAGIAQSEAASA